MLTLSSGRAAASGSLWLRWRSMEIVVDDRCALDGSPCVHAGYSNGRVVGRAKLEEGVTSLRAKVAP